MSIDLTMGQVGTQQQGVSTGGLVLASFTFDSGSLSDYSAEINWGDGTSTVGQIAAGSGGGGAVTGTHTYTATGPDVLGVTVAGDGEVGGGSIPIQVVGAPPTSYADSYTIAPGQTLVTNASSGAAPFGVLANDVDSQGQPLTAALVAGVQHGALSFDSNGTFTYTPATGFVGTDSFTYQASDATATGATTAVTINVVDNAPVANDDLYTVVHGRILTTATFNGVLANDTDADGRAMTASLVSGVQHGTLAFNSDGTFTYTPAPNFYGTDMLCRKPGHPIRAC